MLHENSVGCEGTLVALPPAKSNPKQWIRTGGNQNRVKRDDGKAASAFPDGVFPIGRLPQDGAAATAVRGSKPVSQGIGVCKEFRILGACPAPVGGFG